MCRPKNASLGPQKFDSVDLERAFDRAITAILSSPRRRSGPTQATTNATLECFVQFATSGSVEKIAAAFELARQYDELVVAEQFIDGIELTVAVLDGAALPIVRIEAPQGNYDYQNKYFGSETKYHCPCGLPGAQERAIQRQVLAASR